MEKQLLRLTSVLKKTGQSRAGWYAAVKNGVAPAPVKLNGGRAAAWLGSEIDAYIDRHISERDTAQQLLMKAADDAAVNSPPTHGLEIRVWGLASDKPRTLMRRGIVKVVL